MNFQSFGQTVKGHSRDLDGKSKGKTEQARKVRAKPVGRNQLGVKMQLSLFISTLAFTASWFSIAIPDFRCAWVAGAATGQPTIFARAKAGHKAC